MFQVFGELTRLLEPGNRRRVCGAALQRDAAPRFAHHGTALGNRPGDNLWGLGWFSPLAKPRGRFRCCGTNRPPNPLGSVPVAGSWRRGGLLEEKSAGGEPARWSRVPLPQDVLTLSSSTDSEGENGAAAAGQAPGAANDSDDIQTISSGSGDEDEKRNPAPGAGERDAEPRGRRSLRPRVQPRSPVFGLKPSPLVLSRSKLPSPSVPAPLTRRTDQ